MLDQKKKWPFARGSGATMAIFTAVAAIAACAWFVCPGPATAAVLVLAGLMWLLVLYFFRDPNRAVPVEPGVVLSPGDGKIVAVVQEREERYLAAEVIRISIFLSLTDVHVQRIPLEGRVVAIEHRPGRFLQAFKPEASEVNESVAMVVESAYGRILVKQIAGILARRCVNYARPGDQVEAGQRYGLIRFGSRIDLFLPTTAKVLVAVGDRALGALTPLAHLCKASDAS